jgi:tetratricopeptide (TPR) repeat protein
MRWAITLVLILTACRSSPVGPYTPPTDSERQTTVAEKLNREGADAIATDLPKAEALLREALTKDLFYGPAHNNLGVVFLKQHRLYEAANEFEWARKLLPDSPDPRVNLALVMEQAGRGNDAFRAYEAALEVAPDCLAAIQGAAVCAVRHGRDDSRIDGWLQTIQLRGESLDWRTWAAEQSVRGGRSQ